MCRREYVHIYGRSRTNEAYTVHHKLTSTLAYFYVSGLRKKWVAPTIVSCIRILQHFHHRHQHHHTTRSQAMADISATQTGSASAPPA